VAALRLDGDVDELFVLLKHCAIRITALRLVRNDRNDGRELPAAHLPDMKIGYDGITVTLDGAPDLRWQV
jgi:hypothetical protein